MSVAVSDVKRRIGVTRQVRKVCGTLQKVAAARLARGLREVAQSDLYIERVQAVLAQVSRMLPMDADVHPLMREGGGAGCVRAVVVLGADRGLCGSYNSALMARLGRVLEEELAGESVEIVASGKVIQRRVGKMAGERVAVVPANGIDRVEQVVLDGFVSGRYRSVDLVYWRYIRTTYQELMCERLLPAAGTARGVLPDGKVDAAAMAPLVEPGPEAVLDRMLPALVRARLRACLLHSSVSEHAQRQMSMSRATENAGEMLDDLTRSYRRLRQESITSEMLELIAGMGARAGSPGGAR